MGFWASRRARAEGLWSYWPEMEERGGEGMGRFERRGRRAWKLDLCAECGFSVEAGVAKPDVAGAEVGHVAVDGVRMGWPID